MTSRRCMVPAELAPPSELRKRLAPTLPLQYNNQSRYVCMVLQSLPASLVRCNTSTFNVYWSRIACCGEHKGQYMLDPIELAIQRCQHPEHSTQPEHSEGVACDYDEAVCGSSQELRSETYLTPI